jgi:hypothetical protein
MVFGELLLSGLFFAVRDLGVADRWLGFCGSTRMETGPETTRQRRRFHYVHVHSEETVGCFLTI